MTPSNEPRIISPKSGLGAFLLCMFLGTMGIHRFAVGKIGTGILMLLTFGGLGFWMAYDLIAIACGQFTDSENRYLEISKNPASFHKAIKIVGAIYALFIIFFIVIISTVIMATSKLAAIGQAELAALRTSDFNTAYSYTSTAFQSKVSLDDFKKFVAAHDELQTNVSASFPNRQLNNNDGVIVGSLTLPDGGVTPIAIQFVYENNEWKIVNIDLNK